MEMYQTSETRTTKAVGSRGKKRTIVQYHYRDDWYSYPIDSSKFNRDYAKNKNPDFM